jgi:hypothetical protein
VIRCLKSVEIKKSPGEMHYYTLKYRPPMTGSLPKGFTLVEAPQIGQWRKDIPISSYKFGVVSYTRPLTDDELAEYEMDYAEPGGGTEGNPGGSMKRRNPAKRDERSFAELENVAAIAMEWGRDKKRYDRVYRELGERYGGFVMFYQVAIEAALALETYARTRRIRWGENADWILTIENFAPAILDYAIQDHAWPSTSDQWGLLLDSTVSKE